MVLPKHVVIIMDGNGRWAERRLLPRIMGHQQAVESVRAVVTACVKKEIAALTLFTFSSENWKRPEDEVGFLLNLILKTLQKEVESLHKNNVRLSIIGERSVFSSELQAAIEKAETLTQHNTGLRLNLALNYGGRWDIVQAARFLGEQIARGEILPQDITEATFTNHLSLKDQPEPDFLIRTSGEERISNFLLWQIAYTELYFTEVLWPDFREAEFETALGFYGKRQRRFGKIPETPQ